MCLHLVCCVWLLYSLVCYEHLMLFLLFSFFFFNDTATTEIYTLSLHDALPIYVSRVAIAVQPDRSHLAGALVASCNRSEEHTSELQSPCNLVCRLLLEKKKAMATTRRSM